MWTYKSDPEICQVVHKQDHEKKFNYIYIYIYIYACVFYFQDQLFSLAYHIPFPPPYPIWSLYSYWLKKVVNAIINWQDLSLWHYFITKFYLS